LLPYYPTADVTYPIPAAGVTAGALHLLAFGIFAFTAASLLACYFARRAFILQQMIPPQWIKYRGRKDIVLLIAWQARQEDA